MRRTSEVIIINLLMVISVAAQANSSVAKNDRKVATAKSTQSRTAKLREEDRARRRFWFSMALSNVFDTNISHDEEGLNSLGIVPSFGIHFRDNPERPSFEANYEVAVHRYTNTSEYNRVSQNFTALYRRQLAKRLYARTTGEISLKGSSEDREVNNNYILEQQLQYRLTPATRLAVLAAYRVKRYPFIDRRSNAIDSYIGAKFEQRFRDGRRLELGFRYDKNRAQDPRNSYIRRSYTAEFSTPLSRERGDSISVGVRYSPRNYLSRLTSVNGARVPRRDQRWVFDVMYERPLRPNLLMALGYRYEKRNSNDPEKSLLPMFLAQPSPSTGGNEVLRKICTKLRLKRVANKCRLNYIPNPEVAGSSLVAHSNFHLAELLFVIMRIHRSRADLWIVNFILQ